MKSSVLVALDVPTLAEALTLVAATRDFVGGYKVGLELCTHVGTQTVIDAISAIGGSVFVDLKFKDIPNTVAGAARAVSRPGVLMYTIHSDGGTAMMRAAVAATQASAVSPLVIGVTVLTSINATILADEVRVTGALPDYVVHLAQLAQAAGLPGVICSAHEISAIKAACGQHFVTVTPGVRPVWAAIDDQHRTVTPAQAVQAGGDYIVIGRAITQPPAAIGSPANAARHIATEIEEAQQ